MKTGNTPCGIAIPQDLIFSTGNMQPVRAFVERAEELNGRCIISSQEGGPTRVQAWLPLLQDAS